MKIKLRHSRNGGFFFIPIIFSLGGGMAGAAIGGGAIGGIGISAMFGLTGTQIGGMLGMMAGSMLSNMLFPQENETPWPELNEYPIQKSTNGPPLQRVLGTRIVAGVVSWEGEITSISSDHYGGKGGGGKSGGSAEVTHYQQSFLIDLGEGPASVLKIYANNKQIWPVSPGTPTPLVPDVTIFEGINNSGITDLTGEDYGEWPHNCCVFFDQYNLGSFRSKQNFTFEVSSGAMPYFIGISWTSGYQNAVYKIKSDGSVDTSWADNGKWHYTALPYGGLTACYDLLQLSDGRLLVAHNSFYIEGNSYLTGGSLVSLTMLTAEGEIDTSWGYKGHYRHTCGDFQYPYLRTIKIIQNSSGNFLFFNECNSSSRHALHVVDSEGNRITSYDWQAGPNNSYCQGFSDAIFDQTGTRIIAVGSNQTGPGGSVFNTMAIDPSDGSVDTDWDGNLGDPGYACAKATGSGNGAEGIALHPDGGFLIHHIVPAGDDRSFTKLTSDGEIDTTFGSSGHLEAGYPTWSYQSPICIGNSIWTFGRACSNGVNDPTIQWLRNYDLNGNLIQSQIWDSGATQDNYRAMALIGGTLVFATKNTSPAVNNIENWSRNASFIKGFSTPETMAYARLIQPIAPERAIQDMNFATMTRELLTSGQWGADLGSVKADPINETTFTSVEDYCGAQGLLGSIVISEQRSWRDWLDYICSHFGGYWYESGGQICLGVYRDQAAVANLDEANCDFVIADGDNPPPPIQVKEREYAETFNRIKVTWTDRDNDYSLGGPVMANDETDQRISGQIREKTYDLRGICDVDLAQRMAYRLLVDGMYRFKIYNFTVPYKWMLLEPGDVITITGNPNISGEKVRIFSIDEEQRGRGLAIVAIEDISGLYPDFSFSSQGSMRADSAQISLADGTVNFREDTVTNQLYLSIAPEGAQTNGWYIYRSYDDATYDLIGRCGISGITGGDANSVGTISGNLPAHGSTTWSAGESVLVDIGTITDLHTDITELQFWNNQRLARIGSEIIAFRDVEETAVAGVWKISCLRRGCFGTEAVAHAAGEAFCTLDMDFLYRFTEADIGKTLYFKAVTFYGEFTQNVSSISSFSVTIQGYYKRPAAASLLRLTSDENEGGSGEYSGASFTLYWNLGSRVSGFNYGDWLNLPWNNYIADPELQAVRLEFEQADGTPIGSREIAVGNSATIVKATDLGGYDTARIRVVPRRVLGSRLENDILVTSV